MAKLGELVDGLAEVWGLPRTSVDAYAKPLRKAGLISSSGRTGPGAPDMTVTDATHLLLAFLGGSTTNAVEMTKYISALRFRCFTNDGMSENKAFLDFLSVGNNHTLFDLVSSMIKTAMVGELVEKIAREVTPSTLPIGCIWIEFDESKVSVNVRFWFGEYSNGIEYEGVLHDDAEDIFGALIGDDLRAVADYSYKYDKSDLTVSRKITSKTLNKIAEILNR